MRFRSLHLKAYGSFTDYRLDFASEPGQIDVVLGVNEAGKSTAVRAITNFCYGIPDKQDHQTHPYERLRIGLCMQMQIGNDVHLYRKKGNKNTVLWEDERPAPDEKLTECLCGVGKEGFRALFCLDFKRVQEGSEELLSDGGEIGKLLFEARSDVSLQPILRELHNKSSLLFASASSKPVINASLKAYDGLMKESRAGDIAKYKESERALISLEQDLANLQIKIADLRRDEIKLSRFRSALEPSANRSAVLKELASLGEVVSLPETFEANLRKAQKQWDQCKITLDNLNKESERLQLERSHLVPEPKILALGSEIKSLSENTGNIEKMMKDLQNEKVKVTTNRESAHRELAQIWTDTVNAPQSGSISDHEKRQLKNLDSEGKKLTQTRASLRSQIEEIGSGLVLLKQQIDALPTIVLPNGFEAVVADAKAELLNQKEITRLRGETDELKDKVKQSSRSLHLEASQVDAAISWNVPPVATVRKHEALLGGLSAEIRDLDRRRVEVKESRNAAEMERRSLLLSGDIATELSLMEARDARTSQWTDLRSSSRLGKLGEEPWSTLADEFEHSVEKADDIADRLRREADRTAKLAQIDAAIQSHSEREDQLVKDRDAEERTQMNAQTEWESLWQSIGIIPQTPTEMLEWLDIHAKLCQDHGLLSTAARKLADLIAERNRLTSLLVSGLESMPIDESLQSLVFMAESRVRDRDKIQQERESLSRQIRNENARKIKLEDTLRSTDSDYQRWGEAWKQATVKLKMGSAPSLDDVAEALAAYENAAQFERDAGNAERRETGMESEIQKFEIQVAEIVKALSFVSKADSLSTARKLAETFQVERLTADRLEANEASYTRLSDSLNEVQLKEAEAQALLSDLCRVARCESQDELDHAAQQSSKHAVLTGQLASIDGALRGLSRGISVEEFCQELGSKDPDELEQQHETVEDGIRVSNERLGELNQRIGEARRKLDEAESEGTLLRTRNLAEAELARTRAAVRPYLIYSLAESLVSAQVEEFRKANQGPLLEKASSLFSTLTGGSFVELIPEFESKGKPVLIAVRSNGEQVMVDGLSSASSFALYLALRLACVHHHADTRECLPFVADDILLDFDDARACCALEALADLSRKTQVILFTHHAHLAKIAKDALGNRAVISYLQ